MPRIVILGAGGHAKVVADIARRMGMDVAAFIGPGVTESERHGAPVFRDWDGFALRIRSDPGLRVCAALGDNAKRKAAVEGMRKAVPTLAFAALVHPAATLAPDVLLGEGTVVMAGAVLNPGSVVGTHAIVNTRAVVDHDCRLGDFVSVGPGAVLGGNVTVGSHSAIAIGAVVVHAVRIGEHSVIGAASLVLDDIPAQVTAYGAPCRVVRARTFGEPYL